MLENKAKDTFFSKNRSLNCRGRLLNLSSPKIMGILNITEDSFHDGGLFLDPDRALEHAAGMIEDGADIIDIGASSSRPGAELSRAEDERDRVLPVVQKIREAFPDCILSIDTYHSSVARACLDAGADLINDISTGSIDPEMVNTVAELHVPYLIMHMQGTPGNMQDQPEYHNVTDDIIQYFAGKVHLLKQKGVADILIDPGFGFGKTLDHNYEILAKFSAFNMFEMPLVAGVSRKSMIHKLLDNSSEEALNGSTAVHMMLLERGANILRVHDVKEAVEAIKIFNKTYSKL